MKWLKGTRKRREARLLGEADRMVREYRSMMFSPGSSSTGEAVPQNLREQVEDAYLRQEPLRVPVGEPRVESEGFSRLERLAEEAETFGEPLLDVFATHLRQVAGWNHAVSSGLADVITSVSTEMHGKLDDLDVANALQILGEPAGNGGQGSELGDVGKHDVSVTGLPAAEVAPLFTNLLATAGAEGWDVRIQPGLRSRMAVRPISRLVMIEASAQFEPSELPRLAVHEIGTHVQRAQAGARQQSQLHSIGCGTRAMCAEEGLAVWAEQQAGLLDRTTLRRYAARVLAVRDGMEMPFYELYASLRQHCSPSEAYALAVRVKRPLRDWNEPGAYVKDKVYLEGLRLVAPFAADPVHRTELWSAKISPFDLPAKGEQLLGFNAIGHDPLPNHQLLAEQTGNWLLDRGWDPAATQQEVEQRRR